MSVAVCKLRKSVNVSNKCVVGMHDSIGFVWAAVKYKMCIQSHTRSRIRVQFFLSLLSPIFN